MRIRITNTFQTVTAAILCLTLSGLLLAQEGRGTGRIRGEVVDEAGNPIEGVKVVAESMQYNINFETTSDKNGRWALAGMGTDFFRITASKDGYGIAYHEMRVSQFAKNNPPITFTLKKVDISQLGIPAIQDEGSLAVFEEGNKLYDEEKYAEAAAKFEEFVAKNPTIYQIHFNIGNCYREMGEYDKAIASYNKVLDEIKQEKGTLEGDEAAARALSGIAQTYLKLEDLQKAGEYFKQAVDLFPGDETLAFNVAEIFFNQGETDKAIDYYKTAIGIKEDWPTPYLKIGYAYLNKGEYKLAVESLKKFLALAPDDPQAQTVENLIPELEKLIKD